MTKGPCVDLMGSCEDCHPGIVPRLLGCVNPGEEVSLACAILSLVVSVVAVLIIVALAVCIFTRSRSASRKAL